jgi:hypothetical protein
MHFFFVALMSVLVGASVLPHLLQTPNRPSFSLRKNTSFSLVTIPKFIQKAASLERDAFAKSTPKFLDSEEHRGLASKEDGLDESTYNEETEEEIAAEPALGGYVILAPLDMNSCICKGKNMMSCLLQVRGRCSHPGRALHLETNSISGNFKKRVHCGLGRDFITSLPIRGDKTADFFLKHANYELKRPINLINNCGLVGPASLELED